MTVIKHDFGRKKRQVVRRFTKLLNLDALHEENVRLNPVPYLERASERIYQLEKAIVEAVAATSAADNACSSPASVVINKAEYDGLLRCLAITAAARDEIDAHSD